MKRIFFAVIATLSLSVIVLSGCISESEIILKRARFDLDCSKGKMTVYELGGDAYGVKGCGKKATYVITCPSGVLTENCTAVLNSDSRKAVNSN